MATDFRAFSVANLANPAILPEFDRPWLTAPAIPKFPDRDAYRKWMASPSSTVPLFSLIEGENPALRVDGTNPAYRVWGIVTDYDSTLTDAEVAAGLARVSSSRFPIFAWNRTRRGGVRAIWRFEDPIFYYGKDAFHQFMQRAARELNLEGLFPGLDKPVLSKPDQCYAAGNKWTVNADAMIPTDTLSLWLFDVLRRAHDFSRVDVDIPLELVKAELDKRFPGRWKGSFEEGARGVRFWDPTADNETAAIVRKNGMTAFTGDRPFLSWADIFGREFTSKYQEDRIGRAAAEMWSDNEKNYYRKMPDGTWDLVSVETARRHLRGRYGLSEKVAKGENLSEVDRMLHHLELHRRIEGALPFPHRPKEVVRWMGRDYLNTAMGVQLVKPSEVTDVMWGRDFPFLSEFLSRLLVDEQNLTIVLAWLKVFYVSCLSGKPRRGQALFLVGPPGTGKSFFSLEILSSIFGGYADARNHFVEGNRFNSSMFDHIIWSLDDSTILGDRRMHQKFSGLVKACVANPAFPYEKKYGYSGSAPFEGRFICTLNDDPVSLGILPDTDQSLLDKVILARTDSLPASVTGDVHKNHEIVMAELPSFLRWLVDWEIPDSVELDARFGIKAWHDTEILREARSVSDSMTVMEAVEMWIKDYTPAKPGEPWTGNATELYAALQSHSGVSSVTRRLNPVTLGRQINAAMAGGAVRYVKRGHLGRGEDKRSVYIITKPEGTT